MPTYLLMVIMSNLGVIMESSSEVGWLMVGSEGKALSWRIMDWLIGLCSGCCT